MVDCVADSTFEGVYAGHCDILCLKHVCAGSEEGADLGPCVVIVYEWFICINVKDWSNGVSSEFHIEVFDFE